METVGATGGGDFDECYELILRWEKRTVSDVIENEENIAAAVVDVIEDDENIAAAAAAAVIDEDQENITAAAAVVIEDDVENITAAAVVVAAAVAGGGGGDTVLVGFLDVAVLGGVDDSPWSTIIKYKKRVPLLCFLNPFREAHTKLTWREGSQRSLVVIGDATPHEPNYVLNTQVRIKRCYKIVTNLHPHLFLAQKYLRAKICQYHQCKFMCVFLVSPHFYLRNAGLRATCGLLYVLCTLAL